ncbi:MAG: UDP-N-acetylglucosamine pyrophosphorylase/glucosamine-phosphate N-acetyltransferase [Caproiciproducens sp.]|nr:UDP-N-acetylglucosamine pyrophosphorylase/glucosamine-phosphate N-acetyltransferase [Caproiciproducens sp.]
MQNNCAVILAAGDGKRMKSQKPKVLCEVLFKPMLSWVTSSCESAGISNICVVTGNGSEQVEEFLNVRYQTVFQRERKGTGHAVMMAAEYLKGFSGRNVLVLCGDAPFMDQNTIEEAYDLHQIQNNSVTVITANLHNPTGYGRIIRGQDGIHAIVEQKDADDEQKLINEVNSGTYWFAVDDLLEVLGEITSENSQGEYYLTDAVELILKKGKRADAYVSRNSEVILGANDRKTLLQLNETAKKMVIQKHLENGVEFASTDGVLISPDVEIGSETVILPSTILKGNTHIGQRCVIGPGSVVEDTIVGDDVVLNATQAYQSSIHSDVKIGPFVHIRPNSEIKSKVKIGDFVEIKNSVIGEGTAVSHLTYVGDSDVGENVNFGCGTVTVNYDGVNKFRTQIGDGAFIGCNTNLVAPVKIGNDAYTAAGSTITKDVPDGALGIERGKQEIKEGFAHKKLKDRKKKA